MKELLVVISTYNGEKFLREQLDSILKQEKVELDILIRDDGSNDNTLLIIDEYKSKYENIYSYSGNNIGYIKSFMELLTKANEYKYCALCDQDDIWLPFKCIEGIRKIENERKKHNGLNPPILYYSNATLINEKKEKIGSLYNKKCFQPYNDLILFNCNGSGFTYILNNQLIKLISRAGINIYDSHDRWVQFVARYCGFVIYDHKCDYSLHRVHSNNTSSNILGKKKKFSDLLDIFIGKHQVSNNAQMILKYYVNDITEDNRKSLVKIANYKHSIKSKIWMLFSPKIRRTSFSLTMLLKVRILFESI